jgi:Putative zinc-finger
MEPCSKHKKAITWLALEVLETEESAALRAHLAHCKDCRAYFEQLSNITDKLACTAPDSSIEASEHFHRGVARKLELAQSSSTFGNLSTWFRYSILSWRVALPVVAALVIALTVLLPSRKHPVNPQPLIPLAQIQRPSSSDTDLEPTVANYQKVANQSLEQLSDLLTKQGNKSLPPAPLYTASGLDLANRVH